MKRGDIVDLTIESLGYEGISIARLNGFVIQIRGGLAGERVRAHIVRVRRTYAEAELVDIVEPSSHRRSPPCIYAGDCGGCTWQFATYDEQVRWKEQFIREAYERIAKVRVELFLPIIPSPQEFRYRSKMEFTFSDRTWIPDHRWKSLEPTALERKRPALGLHIRGRFDAVLNIEQCLLQDERANRVIKAIYYHVISSGVSCYNQRTRTGFLRNLIFRSTTLGDLMVIIVTQSPQEDADHEMLTWLRDDLPHLCKGITGVIWAINDTPSPHSIGPWSVLYGHQFLLERLHGLTIHISAQSFFQSNLRMLDRLVQAVIDASKPTKDDIIWDLYCGIGTLTLPLARYCKSIIGLESNSAAIADAKHNASLNAISNAQFATVDLHQEEGWLYLCRMPKPDIVVLDPPRAGIHPKLLAQLLLQHPRRIVYVSCNPITQARDVAAFASSYRLRSVQPLDMFPQTYHVESVALLEIA